MGLEVCVPFVSPTAGLAHPGLCSHPAALPQGRGHQLSPGLRQGCQSRWDWNLGWDSSSGVLIWGPTPLHPMQTSYPCKFIFYFQ